MLGRLGSGYCPSQAPVTFSSSSSSAALRSKALRSCKAWAGSEQHKHKGQGKPGTQWAHHPQEPNSQISPVQGGRASQQSAPAAGEDRKTWSQELCSSSTSQSPVTREGTLQPPSQGQAPPDWSSASHYPQHLYTCVARSNSTLSCARRRVVSVRASRSRSFSLRSSMYSWGTEDAGRLRRGQMGAVS